VLRTDQAPLVALQEGYVRTGDVLTSLRAALVGLGCIVALSCCSSTLYRIH
jgi:hypothetical protein